MALERQVGYVITFGINEDTLLQTYGLVQSYDVTLRADKTVWKSSGGVKGAVQQYGQDYEITLSYLDFSEGSNTPQMGELFSFQGINWIVEELISIRKVDQMQIISLRGYALLRSTV